MAVCKHVQVQDRKLRGMYLLVPLAIPNLNLLQRDFREGEAEVTGKPVNRGAEYGVKVPCMFNLLCHRVLD